MDWCHENDPWLPQSACSFPLSSYLTFCSFLLSSANHYLSWHAKERIAACAVCQSWTGNTVLILISNPWISIKQYKQPCAGLDSMANCWKCTLNTTHFLLPPPLFPSHFLFLQLASLFSLGLQIRACIMLSERHVNTPPPPLLLIAPKPAAIVEPVQHASKFQNRPQNSTACSGTAPNLNSMGSPCLQCFRTETLSITEVCPSLYSTMVASHSVIANCNLFLIIKALPRLPMHWMYPSCTM